MPDVSLGVYVGVSCDPPLAFFSRCWVAVLVDVSNVIAGSVFVVFTVGTAPDSRRVPSWRQSATS
jgi:hypothetical protein